MAISYLATHEHLVQLWSWVQQVICQMILAYDGWLAGSIMRHLPDDTRRSLIGRLSTDTCVCMYVVLHLLCTYIECTFFEDYILARATKAFRVHRGSYTSQACEKYPIDAAVICPNHKVMCIAHKQCSSIMYWHGME